MPELPEVETIIRDLRMAGLEGLRIERARVLWERSLGGMSTRTFCRRVRGRTLSQVHRRGKFIVLHLDNGHALLIHLRMSGRLMLDSEPECDSHARVLFYLSDGRVLRFHNPRKFGRVYLVEQADEALNHLGPEPLERGLTPARLHRKLQKTRRPVKAVIMDQHVIAGVGNIYADEALFDSRLHPERPANSLTPEETGRLLKSLRKVLKKGIRNLGTSLGHGQTNFRSPRGEQGRNQEGLQAYGRAGLPCTVCGEHVQKIIVAQRGTHYCPRCQH